MDKHDTNGQLPAAADRFPWLDYFCLRQLQHDFHPDRVIILIQNIGCLVSSMDRRMTYLKRSFCVLEMYGAVSAGLPYVCHQMQVKSKSKMAAMLARNRPPSGYEHQWWVGPVDAASAQTRDAQDKVKID